MTKNKKKNNDGKTVYFIKDYPSHKAGTSCSVNDLRLNSAVIDSLRKKGTITYSEDEMKVKLSSGSEEIKEKAVEEQAQVEISTEIDELPKPIIPNVNVINVPDEEAKQTIDAAIEKINKLVQDADDYAQLKRESADTMLTNVTQTIEDRVNEATSKRVAELDSRENNIEQIEKDAIAEATKELKTKTKDFQYKIESLLKDKADLDELRANFKVELELDFKDQYDKLLSDKANLENQVTQLNNNIKKLEAEKRGLSDDNSFLEKELGKLKEIKLKVTQLEFEVTEWTTKYTNLEQSYNKKLEEIGKLNIRLLEYGNNPEQALKEKEKLEDELRKLKDLMADTPDAEELAELRTVRKSLEDLTIKYNKMAKEKALTDAKNVTFEAMESDIENYKRYIRVLEAQKAELEHELKRNADLYSARASKVFANLSEIDNVQKYPLTAGTNNTSITLKDLCTKFRGYLAFRNDKKQLYYDEDVIRTFVAGFASARLTILEGLSGTGKSSLPRAFMDFVGAHTIEVPVQSSWKDRNDLLGFYNDFKKQYKETDFLKALYTATHDKNGLYLIVLDEMNLSRIEYYFADLLSVLEKDPQKWEIELISDYASINTDINAWPENIHDGKLSVLENTWFIGTANKDDSTFMITDKVYDRSVIIDFQSKGMRGTGDQTYKYYDPIPLDNEDFQRLMRSATRISENDKRAYKEVISYLDQQVRMAFDITFGNRIENQLDSFVPCYMNCGGTYFGAIDIMFSKKVLRKLEGKYDDSTKMGLLLFAEEITKKQWDKSLPRTINTLKKMADKI